MRLSDRTAVVTGGASGLGAGIARRFAQEGASVALIDRNLAGAQQVADAIAEGGGRATAVELDLYQTDEIEPAIARVRDELGRIDILVNSAGIFNVASIAETTEELWDRHLDLNLKALFFACRAVTPLMREQRHGRIINLSSIAGMGGFLDCPAYCASKGAIINLTRALACELGRDGITVNAIAPGPIETPINNPFDFDNPKGDAHRRYLADRTPTGVSFYKVEDVTGSAVFLASDESSAITGITLPVDGGWTAW